MTTESSSAAYLPCPTPCDDDCESDCHEWHQPYWKREHIAGSCQIDAITALVRALAASTVQRGTDDEHVLVKIDARLWQRVHDAARASGE
jgi:hypothetical protein